MPWYLLRPDLHRLVIVSFQDARYGNDSCILTHFRVLATSARKCPISVTSSGAQVATCSLRHELQAEKALTGVAAADDSEW